MKTETNLPERCVGDIERFKAVSACDQWASCAINSCDRCPRTIIARFDWKFQSETQRFHAYQAIAER